MYYNKKEKGETPTVKDRIRKDVFYRPGNDDAIRAVKLIVSKMADAVIEANQGTAEADGEIEAESEEFAETVEE